MPPRINGIRRPIFVLVRSLSAPKNGSKNSASTLSAAMIAPEMVSSKWNVFVKISGMMLSYICQNAQMDKKRQPHQHRALVVKLHSRSPCKEKSISLESQ